MTRTHTHKEWLSAIYDEVNRLDPYVLTQAINIVEDRMKVTTPKTGGEEE